MWLYFFFFFYFNFCLKKTLHLVPLYEPKCWQEVSLYIILYWNDFNQIPTLCGSSWHFGELCNSWRSLSVAGLFDHRVLVKWIGWWKMLVLQRMSVLTVQDLIWHADTALERILRDTMQSLTLESDASVS